MLHYHDVFGLHIKMICFALKLIYEGVLSSADWIYKWLHLSYVVLELFSKGDEPFYAIY